MPLVNRVGKHVQTATPDLVTVDFSISIHETERAGQGIVFRTRIVVPRKIEISTGSRSFMGGLLSFSLLALHSSLLFKPMDHNYLLSC
jgi:hypothetical protein